MKTEKSKDLDKILRDVTSMTAREDGTVCFHLEQPKPSSSELIRCALALAAAQGLSVDEAVEKLQCKKP